MPHFALRAGLVGFLFFAFLSFTACAAPLPYSSLLKTPSSSSSSSALSSLREQSLPTVYSPPRPVTAQAVNPHTPEITRKIPQANVVASEEEMVILHRRNIFTKLFHKIKDGITHVADKIGHAIVHVAKKIGTGVVQAAKKVGHFMQTTGAKIAKVGLKIVSTVQKAVSKVAQFIPVIGKPLSKVMDAEADGENKLSDKIHAHIGGKLGQAMKNMSKAQKYMGYVPRQLAEGIVQKRSLEKLGERELYAGNVALSAREEYAVDALLRRE